ncbi:uncharacterized protein F4822DRAFT_426428 [Hypoxylon trugodes]|uniref:uncharacterized protein n=1 Tax=Hypoxylon trugodes TaxID=326681 RepID=UPI0021A122AD|nr:uncharacterized protein F4822DRAFT_426428 [Hypoxylon trugodes]KAI1390580.1 hypothetical protein F4822DRAFT_426428 [Hypoxylon trugodes]
MAEKTPFPSPTKRWHTTAQPSASHTRPELSAKGKSVVVTGGGTGIGGETARHFAAAGASRIALLGRREQPLLDNKAYIKEKFPGVEVFIKSTDVTKESDVEEAFSQFAENGKIHVLVHSAAAVGPSKDFENSVGEEYLEGINTNVAGSFWVARSFLRHSVPDAVVVAINSWGSYLSVNNNFASYCVAKLATYRLWDTVAILKPKLYIFHTQPGVILTEMNLKAGGAESFKNIKADDVSLPASFNLWLSSPEARFLKNKFLWCNWDVEELKAQAKEIESTQKFSIGLVGWPFENAN